jgi:Pyruvate/2-oxoacid:ferredoxin oxidoreductase delta subunit
MNVFSAVKGAPPVVARKEDCQTCFMCELYCPADALYVARQAEAAAAISEQADRQRPARQLSRSGG